MPQYEVKDTHEQNLVSRVRANSPEDAVKRHFEIGSDVDVEVEGGRDFEALSGWRTVLADGKEVGHIRLFQRMKFRRA